MPNRILPFLLPLVMMGWLDSSPARAEAPAPLVTVELLDQEPTSEIRGAGSSESAWRGLENRDPFQAGALTFQSMVGYYVKCGVGAHGPAIDYAPIAARVGYILNAPSRADCLRGFFEVLLEANYSPITRSYGSYFAGPNAIVRFNFVQPECLIVPYIQGGAGFAFNDAYKTPDSTQSLIGEEFEFLLRAEVGARYMVSERISLDIEAGFQHISNAGLAKHNGGLNNVGGGVGVTYFFGRGR